MTWLYADSSASVLAFDPDDEAISEARRQLPENLRGKVEFRVAEMMTAGLNDESYDVGVLAWSI
jgi:predicted RNA methylase